MERVIKAAHKYLSEKKVLNLVVSKKWFEKIASGEKTEEYREIKVYWMRRLLLVRERYRKLHIGKNFEMLIDTDTIKEKMNINVLKFAYFSHVRFFCGYAKNRPWIEKEIESITIGKPKKGMCPDEWLDTEFFVIKFK